MEKIITLDTRYYRLFPPEQYAGYAYERYSTPLRRSAFLVVDVYGLGFHPDDPVPAYRQKDHHEEARPALAWLGSADHEKRIIEEALLPALNAARAAGMTVIYLNNSAPKIGLAQSEFGKMLKRQLNTTMEEMFAETTIDPKEYHYGESDHVSISKLLYPRENEYFIRKHVYSGFVGTRLDLLLRYLDIKTLFAVGFSADACLLTTVIDALWHDYKTIVLRDCTLANDMPEEQEGLLGTERMIRLMESLYCVTCTSQEFIQALAPLTTPSETGEAIEAK